MISYCDCLNVCIQFIEDSDLIEDYNLSDEEKQSEFFLELPVKVKDCTISEQISALIKLSVIGSWIVHKCMNCSISTHAARSDGSTTIMFVNNKLKKFSDQEWEMTRNSLEFSPVFEILITDNSSSLDYGETSHLTGETSNAISELKGKLTEKVEERRNITDKMIEKFVQEQQNALKKFISRANDDFQCIKSAVLSNCALKNESDIMNEPDLSTKNSQGTSSGDSVISNFNLSASLTKAEQNKERNSSLSEMSFDSEGLFLLDGVEDNVNIEEEDHSEEDLSDTDDSGSRDEGIHIPRRKSVAIARSLPIRVRNDFDSSLSFLNDRFEDTNGKPNYKRKMRNVKPVDIAASMRALANSVHGNTIFGDLPPPRIGSRI